MRGRSNVLQWLAARPPTAPPASYELRDGQVYRWAEPAEADRAVNGYAQSETQGSQS
jgi:hypothetical protein